MEGSNEVNSACLPLTKDPSGKQDQTQSEETEEFHEFDHLVACVEEFEHNRAVQSSSDSNKDDSDSDDEDANLIKKQFSRFRKQQSTRKSELKQISIK